MLVLKGHRKRVRCLAFSPDGSLLASAAGKGHAISLWDTRRGKRLRFLSWHGSTITSLTFSPTGDLLASTDSQGRFQLWEVPSGEARIQSHWPVGSANQLAFAPDGRTFLTATWAWPMYQIAGRDLATTTILDTLSGSRHFVACMSLAADGEALAVGAGAGVDVWDLSAKKLRMTLPQSTPVRAVAYAPDGRTLAVAALRQVWLWDPTTGTPRITLRGHEKLVTAIALTHDGRALLSASNDRTVRVWDLPSGRQLTAYDWQIGQVHAIAIAPDGMRAAAGGDALIVLWDLDCLPA